MVARKAVWVDQLPYSIITRSMYDESVWQSRALAKHYYILRNGSSIVAEVYSLADAHVIKDALNGVGVKKT
jgi:hypothetical protein